MKSSFQVKVTETSLVIAANARFLTSIPLRRWSTTDGSRWSSQLRTPTEVERLVLDLTQALEADGPQSVMKRVRGVLSAESGVRPRTPTTFAPVLSRIPPPNKRSRRERHPITGNIVRAMRGERRVKQPPLSIRA